MSGNSYAPLTNSPLSSALANAQTSLSSPAVAAAVASQGVAVNGGGNGQQFVSYNGDTYLIQTSPNGTHQLVATLNGRSMSPNQGGGNLVAALEKPYNNNEPPTENNNASQVCKILSLSFPELDTLRGEYFGKIWQQDFQGRNLFAIGGHSENFRSLGPTGAEI